MAGEFMVVNPRHRRRRARRARGRVRTKRRRKLAMRRNPNPRRRRRRSYARRHLRRRSYARNPRGFNLGGIDVGAAALTAGGFVGSTIAANFISRSLPAEWSAGPNAPLVRIGLKAAVGVGLPLIARRFIGARVSNLLAAGAAVSVLVDLWATYAAPALGMSDYETGTIQGYETGTLGELPEAGDGGGSIYGGSIYG